LFLEPGRSAVRRGRSAWIASNALNFASGGFTIFGYLKILECEGREVL